MAWKEKKKHPRFWKVRFSQRGGKRGVALDGGVFVEGDRPKKKKVELFKHEALPGEDTPKSIVGSPTEKGTVGNRPLKKKKARRKKKINKRKKQNYSKIKVRKNQKTTKKRTKTRS